MNATVIRLAQNQYLSMDTQQLIELVTSAQSGEFVDWRPVAKRLDSTDFHIDTPCSTNGWTLLQWALEHDDNQTASFAIARGASIDAKGTGSFDCTPLDVAVRKGNDRYVDMFLRHGGTGTLPATSKRMDLIEKGKATIRQLIADCGNDSFVDATEHFKELLGVKPRREKQTGLVRFRKVSLTETLSLTGKKSEQLEQVVPAFAQFSSSSREHGAILYGESWLGASLAKI